MMYTHERMGQSSLSDDIAEKRCGLLRLFQHGALVSGCNECRIAVECGSAALVDMGNIFQTTLNFLIRHA